MPTTWYRGQSILHTKFPTWLSLTASRYLTVSLADSLLGFLAGVILLGHDVEA